MSKPLALLGSTVLFAASALGLGCGAATPNPQAPGVSVEHHLAEGHNPDALPRLDESQEASQGAPAAGAAPAVEPAAAAAPDASASSGATEPKKTGSAPDPEPLRLADQWEYLLAFSNGHLRVESVRPVKLPAPAVTPRHMGRFAIELWLGKELVERVRFDIPLVGDKPAAPDAPKPLHAPAELGVTTTKAVLVPASPRATRALLVDRATGEETPLAWPPDTPLRE